MENRRSPLLAYCMVSLLSLAAGTKALSQGSGLPSFGRDTVLVWKIQNQGETNEFVVRIAEFLPDRFVEWETETTQGTIFIPGRALATARIFVTASLFEAGVDSRGRDKTTLWLSQQAFREVKEKRRAKVSLDAIDSWFTFEGKDEITVDVNRTPARLPVIIVKDDRGSVRAFLDLENNPLLVRHSIRAYNQVLSSITTDRPNTLRWIKGKKLTNPH